MRPTRWSGEKKPKTFLKRFPPKKSKCKIFVNSQILCDKNKVFFHLINLDFFPFKKKNISQMFLPPPPRLTPTVVDRKKKKEILAICEEKLSLRMRQTRLILKKTVIMRRNISCCSAPCLLVPSPPFSSRGSRL